MAWDGPVTWRQLRAWTAWFQLEYDHPSRNDWYLMQIAQAMQGGKITKYQLPFREKKLSKETRTLYGKAKWGAVLGVNLFGGKPGSNEGKDGVTEREEFGRVGRVDGGE